MRTRVVVSKTENKIPANAATRGVFIRSRIRGEGCAILCSIGNTSKSGCDGFIVTDSSTAAKRELFLYNHRAVRFCHGQERSEAAKAAHLPTFRTFSGSSRAKSSISLATSLVQPVWWLAPSPAPLSPWKYL